MQKSLTVLGLAMTAALASPALADIVVIGSDSAALTTGTVLTSDKTLEVPAGAKVRIMATSGKIQSLVGPLSKAVKDFDDGGASDSALWTAVTERLKPVGPRAEVADAKSRGFSAAPARSATAPAGPAPVYKFSWVEVPVFRSGDLCVEKGARLSVVRATTAKAERVVIVDMQGGGKRSEVNFVAGSAVATWPADIEPRTGTFAFQAVEQPIRQIKLRLIAPLPATDDAVRVLHGQRCELQRDALLEALKNPAFQLTALGE
ncbi:MAG: hypothetical protein ACT4N2_05350 [Hyphomicrobium sp.]